MMTQEEATRVLVCSLRGIQRKSADAASNKQDLKPEMEPRGQLRVDRFGSSLTIARERWRSNRRACVNERIKSDGQMR